MLRVCGSSPKYSMRSPQPTSSMEPIERNALKPTCSRRLQSRIAVQIAPLWLTSATLPGRAIVVAKVAFNPARGLITPRQLGPMMRMRPRLASSSTWRSSSAPALPASLKPAEMMIAPFTPAATHSRTTPGTVLAGVTITARSTLSGTAATVGYARIPSTLVRFGLTGNTVPPNGLLIKFQRIVRPTLAGDSVAPITATLRGAKNTSRGRRRRPRISCADSVPGRLSVIVL